MNKKFGECRREYIGLESSTLSRSIKIYGAELSAILSPNLFHCIFAIHFADNHQQQDDDNRWADNKEYE